VTIFLSRVIHSRSNPTLCVLPRDSEYHLNAAIFTLVIRKLIRRIEWKQHFQYHINVIFSAAELDNIEAWATENNLTLNRLKTKEVVFYDRRRRHCVQSPSTLPVVARDTTLKVLGVTFSSNLSTSDHIRRVISDSAQSLYALRVLRHHGLNDVGLQTVFRAVVVSRLTYAAPARRGFATTTEIKRVDAFLRRCKRCGYPSDLPDFDELLDESDDRLFCKT